MHPPRPDTWKHGRMLARWGTAARPVCLKASRFPSSALHMSRTAGREKGGEKEDKSMCENAIYIFWCSNYSVL